MQIIKQRVTNRHVIGFSAGLQKFHLEGYLKYCHLNVVVRMKQKNAEHLRQAIEITDKMRGE